MYEVPPKTRLSVFELAQKGLLKVGVLAVLLLLPTASNGGVLAESDLQKIGSLKPLFASLMNDLAQTARRADVSAGDVNCINSTMEELLQISDELASYEYLIAMDKDISGFGEKNPMRDLVKFAADKSGAILTSERKRLVQLSDRCAHLPLAAGKTQQALQVIDTTAGILATIRDHL